MNILLEQIRRATEESNTRGGHPAELKALQRALIKAEIRTLRGTWRDSQLLNVLEAMLEIMP